MAPYTASTTLKILLTLVFSLSLLLAFILVSRKARLFVAGLFIALTLALPPSLVVENEMTVLGSLYQVFLPGQRAYDPLPGWVNLIMRSLFLLPVIVISSGVIMAAVLFASGLRQYLERAGARTAGPEGPSAPRNPDGRRADYLAGASLALSLLVLAVTLHNLYWLMVWDKTTDSIGIFWLVLTFPAVMLSGSLAFLYLFRRATLAGLSFAVLVPVLLIVVSVLAWRTDYRALTEARAERVVRAIEAYHAREGRYPQSLPQLVPRYLLSLPGPVIINGLDWCYDAGQAGYQFGYLDREHWSSPNPVGNLFSRGGAVQDLPDLCGLEIEVYKEVRGW